MTQIDLAKETINAIVDAIIETTAEETRFKHTDNEVEQDDMVIMFDFSVYGHYEQEEMIHTEFAYNNIEDLSHWETDWHELDAITAFDENGEEYEISDASRCAIEKRLAA